LRNYGLGKANYFGISYGALSRVFVLREISHFCVTVLSSLGTSLYFEGILNVLILDMSTVGVLHISFHTFTR